MLRQEESGAGRRTRRTHGAAQPPTFESELRRRVGLSKRRGLGFTLAMVDLDHFKAVNHSFGHPEGDAVLRRAGEAIRLSLRGSDRIFRLGGEEFAPRPSDNRRRRRGRSAHSRDVRRSRRLASEPWLGTRTSASIGWAVYPDDADDRNELDGPRPTRRSTTPRNLAATACSEPASSRPKPPKSARPYGGCGWVDFQRPDPHRRFAGLSG